MKNKTKTSETTLSLVNAEGIDSVGIIGGLKQELSKLTKVSETPFKVSGSITVGGQNIDISSETSIAKLINTMALVEVGEAAYNKTADTTLKNSLNGTYPPFKINGNLVSAIAHDINLKIEVISYSERKKELEELLQEAQGFLTREDQFKMFQQKLAAKLGGNQ